MPIEGFQIWVCVLFYYSDFKHSHKSFRNAVTQGNAGLLSFENFIAWKNLPNCWRLRIHMLNMCPRCPLPPTWTSIFCLPPPFTLHCSIWHNIFQNSVKWMWNKKVFQSYVFRAKKAIFRICRHRLSILDSILLNLDKINESVPKLWKSKLANSKLKLRVIDNFDA